MGKMMVWIVAFGASMLNIWSVAQSVHLLTSFWNSSVLGQLVASMPAVDEWGMWRSRDWYFNWRGDVGWVAPPEGALAEQIK